MTDNYNDWATVTEDDRCLICGKGDWCRRAPDGQASACHRQTDLADKVVTYGNGQEVGIFFSRRAVPSTASRITSDVSDSPSPVVATRKIQLAAPDVLDANYRELLSLPQLTLTDADRQHLRDRGLTDEQIDQGMFRSFVQKSLSITPRETEGGEELRGVPGFRCHDSKWQFVSPKGILIPVFNVEGQIVALKVRVSRPGKGAKYLYVTSSKSGGASPGSPVHCPLKVTNAITLVRVTEGELKATVATHRSGILTLSSPGVYGWRGPLEVAQQLGVQTVRVAFDMDAYDNPAVAQQLGKFVDALRDAGFTIELELWKSELGKGIDDVLAAGKASEIDLVTGDRVAKEVDALLEYAGVKSCKTASREHPDALRRLVVTNEEAIVADRVIDGIKDDLSLYSRNGSMIVRIVQDDGNDNSAIERHVAAPRMQEYPQPALRELITRYFKLQKISREGGLVDSHVPPWLVPAICSRTNLPFRRLEAVVPFPTLLANGSILQQPGYDPQSGLFLACDLKVDVPTAPSRQDAAAAALVLLELISDFPFQQPEHQSAWLAFLLTLLARFAFNGPSPLFLIDANVRGSGKTLLAELVALIVLGQSLARMTNPESDEECRKRITALVIRGEMLVLIDNIVGSFGCGSLDAALTGSVWSDRILGKSETVEFPLKITWVGSGNNIQIVADTSRRVCPIRLQSPEENPENRSGFKLANIAEHVLQHRARYLTAALTILRAHAVAGRPDVGARPWGSFEGWSRIVRDALVWCGQPDPARAREEFVQFSDREAGLLKQLLAGWEEIDHENAGLTIAEIVNEIESSKESYLTLRNALAELCPPKAGRFNARSIGCRLLHLRGRNCGGKAFDSRVDRKGVQRWRVVLVESAGFAGSAGSRQPLSTVKHFSPTPTSCVHAREIIEASQPDPASPANPAPAIDQGEV